MPILRKPGPWRDELARFAASLPERSLLVEVGSFAGDSSEIFLASKQVSLLICVDLWSVTGRTFPSAKYMAAAECEFDRRCGLALKIKRSSLAASELFKADQLDAVYIDGDHRYDSALADLKAWCGKVRPGGIVAGHDWFMPDVRRAAYEVLERDPDAIYGDGERGMGTWAYTV